MHATYTNDTGFLIYRFSAHSITWCVSGKSARGRIGRVRNSIGIVCTTPKKSCIVHTKVGSLFNHKLSHNFQHGVLDCEEEFRDAGELLDHTKDMHGNSDLRPSTTPVPHPGRVLSALPQKVSSWSIFPALVTPASISADRHSQVGRWVSFIF